MIYCDFPMIFHDFPYEQRWFSMVFHPSKPPKPAHPASATGTKPLRAKPPAGWDPQDRELAWTETPKEWLIVVNSGLLDVPSGYLT